jgi:hypothetical protein
LAWLWATVTAEATAFRITRSRGADVLHALVGYQVAPVVVSDRFPTYARTPNRQMCWAHLRRDFQAMIERAAGDESVGAKLAEQPLSDGESGQGGGQTKASSWEEQRGKRPANIFRNPVNRGPLSALRLFEQQGRGTRRKTSTLHPYNPSPNIHMNVYQVYNPATSGAA